MEFSTKDLFWMIVTAIAITVLMTGQINLNNIINEKPNNTILVSKMGNIEQKSIDEVIHYVEKLTNFKCQVSDKNYPKMKIVSTDEHFSKYKKGQTTLYDKSKPIELIITDAEFLHYYSLRVWGICYGNTIYLRNNDPNIKATAIHEILHNFGLDHCHEDCVMNSDCIKPWDNKNDKPKLCDRHKIQLSGALPNLE